MIDENLYSLPYFMNLLEIVILQIILGILLNSKEGRYLHCLSCYSGLLEAAAVLIDKQCCWVFCYFRLCWVSVQPEKL